MKKAVCFLIPALVLALALSACSAPPPVVEVTSPPLPTATVEPTSTPIKISREEEWTGALYNQLALDLAAKCPPTENVLLCPPALAASLHSLYWAAGDGERAELETVLGRGMPSDAQSVNARSLLDWMKGLEDLAPRMLLRLYAGPGVSIHESVAGKLGLYFDTELRLADMYTADWSRDLSEDMSLATGGLLAQTLPAAPEGSQDVLLLSCVSGNLLWQTELDPHNDKADSFQQSDGNRVSVMMMRKLYKTEIHRAAQGTIAVLPLADGFEGWLILPRTGETVLDMLAFVTADELARWRSLAEEEATGVALPPLDMTLTGDYAAILRGLGLTKLSGGMYDTLGIGFPGADAVTQCARLRLSHEGGTDAPAPSPTPLSQVITRPKDPNLICADRECMLVVADKDTGAFLWVCILRRIGE